MKWFEDILTGGMVIVGVLVIGALLCLVVAGTIHVVSHFHDRRIK